MLSSEEFIRLSLETNLFFARIAREHAVFLQIGFTSRDFNLARRAEIFNKEFTKLLAETLELSGRGLSNSNINYGELVSSSTLQAEKLMEFCAGIELNTSVTNIALSLEKQNRFNNGDSTDLVDKIVILNERVIILLTSFVEFEERLLYDILHSRVFMHMSPLFVDHLLRETRVYLEVLLRLQERMELYSTRGISAEVVSFNNFMSEHAKLMCAFLDPSEDELKNKMDILAKEFERLTQDIITLAYNKITCQQLVCESLEVADALGCLIQKITLGILACNVKSSVLPLLVDHFAREVKHAVRIMGSFK